MREYITAHAVANAIRMKRSLFFGAFLLVEGVTDKHIYGLVVDPETCKIEIAHGRDNVLDAIAILDADGFHGSLAIVDADLANVTGSLLAFGNILQTDLHDLECMMLNSPALDRLLDEYGSEERVAAFAAKYPLMSRQFAMAASPLGCLRLISLRDQLNLKFKGVRFVRFIDVTNLAIITDKMVREVVNNSQMHELDKHELVDKVSLELGAEHDCWQISCGHDIIAILSLALRSTLGRNNSGDVSVDNLERSLRLAYEASFLQETNLYESIANWENAHPNFTVLKSQPPTSN